MTDSAIPEAWSCDRIPNPSGGYKYVRYVLTGPTEVKPKPVRKEVWVEYMKSKDPEWVEPAARPAKGSEEAKAKMQQLREIHLAKLAEKGIVPKSKVKISADGVLRALDKVGIQAGDDVLHEVVRLSQLAGMSLTRLVVMKAKVQLKGANPKLLLMEHLEWLRKEYDTPEVEELEPVNLRESTA
jgi:hypothetical protein